MIMMGIVRQCCCADPVRSRAQNNSDTEIDISIEIKHIARRDKRTQDYGKHQKTEYRPPVPSDESEAHQEIMQGIACKSIFIYL